MNIYQKLIEVRKAVPYLQKENAGHQYKYVSSSQTLSSVRAKLDEMNLLLIPEVVGTNVLTETVENNNKKTTTYFTELTMRFTWVNAENPEEKIVCPWYGQGVDIAGEKGVGKAMTYAEKYFMLKFFNIATDKDDPDAFQRDNETAATKEQPRKPAQKPATPETAEQIFNTPASKPDKMTDKQRGKMMTTMREKGVSKEDVVNHIGITFGKVSTKELTSAEASRLIEWLEAKEAAA